MADRARIKVKGVVQGVGFRPYVYNLADSLSMKGYVTNTSDGVDIDIEGGNLTEFIERLPIEAPALSKIVEVSVSHMPVHGYTDFRILESRDEDGVTMISQDVSICDDCLKELFDPDNRRYLYPFINCTNCGPRYTITKAIPYDRPNTTMSVFEMCDECRQEYHNPKDRRFHAQPNACPECGPNLKFKVQNSKFKINDKENPIESAIRLLKEGAIVAVRGLGGFHIACDATNEAAVKSLRERKRKSNKPFALMAPDIDSIEKFCKVSKGEKGILLSNRRPIVLLKKRNNYCLPDAVSPNNQYAGFMLPYTPLHYLLFFYPHSALRTPHFSALVMTSGNLSEEPIVKDNDDALKKLSGIVDAFLFHDRDIFMRVDDSVVRVMGQGAWTKGRVSELQTTRLTLRQAQGAQFCNHGEPVYKHGEPVEPSPKPPHNSSLLFIRRSRGYVPEPIDLYSDGPEVLGCGADLKNTFTVTKGRFAIPGQHVGDMENYETLQFFEESLENIKAIYRVNPVAIAYDLHPNYLSTKWALKQGSRFTVHGFGIQHHYAHIASVMAEHSLNRRVIGVAFDGTGYGIDSNLWGGEFLIADVDGFERAGHLTYIPLPGGESAIKEPWRTAVSYIVSALVSSGRAREDALRYLGEIGFIERYGINNIDRLLKVIDIPESSPLSSGAGRLFDAVSAIIGLCDRNTFEGEAAVALESLTLDGIEDGYNVNLKMADSRFVIDFSESIISIIEDLIHNRDKHEIATKFHNTVSNVILKAVKEISGDYQLNDVVLSGGTFQNLYLLERTRLKLTTEGMDVFINEKVPCNDGGISLGQAYIIRERLRKT